MALLRQSLTWPIHTARGLHATVQRSFLWQLYLNDENGALSYNIMLLGQRASIPGIEIDRMTYSVGGLENYALGKSRRGGVVSLSLLETEGLEVERFFRDWFNDVDVPVVGEEGLVSRVRTPKGDGSAGSGHARRGLFQLFTRARTVSAEFELLRLMPLRLGKHQFSYEGSGPMILPVELVCDEVRRVD